MKKGTPLSTSLCVGVPYDVPVTLRCKCTAVFICLQALRLFFWCIGRKFALSLAN